MSIRIIAFGDLHDYVANIGKIEGIADASLLIITGDLTNRGGADRAGRVIEQVRHYNPRVYAQAGNMDQREVEDYLIEQGINLHGQGYMVAESVGIFGVGGSNPTPFNTPNEFDENEIASFILQGYGRIEDAPLKILISHAPPRGTRVDRTLSGQHVGSRAVREFIETYQPDICLTGHIHEARGEDLIGRTKIFNPGMLKNGGYVEVHQEGLSLIGSLKQIAGG
ncbi:MAG: metallophosphoesterase [bacterium]|nr:metallophosphoesterase [bacterium]